MTITRVAAALASLVLIAGCTSADEDGPEPEPDLSTVRDVAWTVTADQIAGAKGARMGTIGGVQSVDSVAAGNLVVSAVDSRKALTLAGIDAKSGKIAWRRVLPLNERFGWTCVDDDGGSVVACSIGDPDADTDELHIIDIRTGTVETQLEIDADQSVGIEGEQLYLTTFLPADKERRLDVTVERRSWSTGKVAWRHESSFAIEGWGHDGGQGFTFGPTRVLAYSALWEVVLDRRTGRLLSRSDEGRFEEPMGGGGWLVNDSGDGTQDELTITVFAPTGEPVAEDRLPHHYWADRTDHRLVSTGRHLREQSTGRSLFEAPKGTQIVEFTDGGRVVVTEPANAEHGEDEKLTYQVWDVGSGKVRGTVDVTGDAMSDSLGSGSGVVLVADRFDEKTERMVPPTLYVIDLEKPGHAASIDLGWTLDVFDSPTLVRTPAGAAVTGPTGVKGLVVRP